MKIPEVANNLPQRVYVVKLPSELVTQIEKMPPLPQEVKMEERCETLWRATSHF